VNAKHLVSQLVKPLVQWETRVVREKRSELFVFRKGASFMLVSFNL